MMRPRQIEGPSDQEIQDEFALPAPPKYMTTVPLE